MPHPPWFKPVERLECIRPISIESVMDLGEYLGMETEFLRADILCNGVRIDDAYKKEIIETDFYANKRASLGSGRFFILDDKYVINVPVREQFVENSPYYLTKKNERWVVSRDNEFVCGLQLIPWPAWYMKSTTDGLSMRQVCQHHGLHNIAGGVRGDCDFWVTGMQCMFCAIGLSQNVQRRTPQQIQEVVLAALNENPFYDLHLGGGTTLTSDKGAIANAEVIALIKSEVKIPICVEMVPPDTDSHIDAMVDVGLDSIMFNLEIYDDHLRNQYCPGKSSISKDRYFQALKYCMESLGEGQVGSQLILGLEPSHSTIQGAKELIEIGVKPKVVVFRPLNGTPLMMHPPPSTDLVLEVYGKVTDLLKDSGLLQKGGKAGCVACEACYLFPQ